MTAKRFQKKNRGKLSLKQLVECVCPKCAKIHERFIFWSGRGTPRIYCIDGVSGCNIIAEEIYELEAHGINNNTDIVSTLLEFA
jgi:hypothetical protein